MQSGMDDSWAYQAGRLMKQIETEASSFAPYQFVQTMRQAHPIFDDKDEKGNHKQQDADECFQSMLQSWRNPLRKQEIAKGTEEEMADVIGNLFEIELTSSIKNVEAPDEVQQGAKEKVLRLSCHIDNNNNPINMLTEGLRISMEGQIEKYSPMLDRNAIFNKSTYINKLVS